MRRRGWISGLLLAMAVGSAAIAAPSATTVEAEIAAAKAAMMTEPKQAYAHAGAALALADREEGARRQLDRARAQWLVAEALTRTKRPEEALPILSDALQVVVKAAPDTKLHGDILKSRGHAEAVLGKIQPALQDFQSAYTIYARAKEPRSQAIALQEIGSIYLDARDYPHVLQYYAQAREAFAADPALNMSADNNRAFALKDLGRAAEAEAEFRRALASAQLMKSGYLEAHILTNIAFTEALQGKASAARKDAERGLKLAAHDPEAAGEKPFLLGVLAKVAADTHDEAAAASLLDQVFAGQDLAKTPMDYRDFHELAVQVYERAGDRDKALQHMKAFKRLDDEGRALAASTSAQLVAAKFDFANQATKIAELKASQAQAKARFAAIMTGVLLIAGLIVTSLITQAFFQMRRSRNRIRAVNAELETSNAALEKALKAKTEFLATTSHEIRTPLNGILGMTQVMLADGRVTGDIRERLTLVKSAGDTMQALVNDLLDVAKIETGALSVSRSEIDLAKLMRDAAAVWSDQAKAKNLEFRLDLADCPARIVEDSDRLRQVVFNLLSNATKFTETGWVSLRTFARPEGAGEVLCVEVADSGIGVPADQFERIFESFTQVDSAKTRQYAGTGLGLAVCRNVAQALGGRISLASTLGEGSTFTLELPLARAETSGGEAGGDGLLVVDDNLLAQAMMRAFLADKVGRLEFVGELEAAVTASAGFPQVLLDGACLKRLAPENPIGAVARFARPDVQLLVLWPSPDAETEQALKTAGALRVLSKPISPVALIQEIAETSKLDPATEKAA